MPWDCMCPKCSSVVLGDMTEDEEEMQRQWDLHEGEIILCDSCNTRFIFDTLEIVGG